MRGNRQKELYIYRFADYLTAVISWLLYFMYRKQVETGAVNFNEIFSDKNFYWGIILIPFFWIILYQIFDKYKDIYRYSRLSTLFNTLIMSFLGTIVIYFTILLDDKVLNYISSIHSFFALFLIHFLLTSSVRMVLLTKASRRLKAGKVLYNTLIVGGESTALELYEEITSRPFSLGHDFIGYIDSNGKIDNELSVHLPRMGKIENLSSIIEDQNIEEVIIAIETSEHNRLREILSILDDYRDRLLVKIIPDMYDIMLGSVKMNHVYGAVLIEIDQDLMPQWQWFTKRAMDIVVSIIGILILIPLYIFAIIKVKLSSPGPIFFLQERIGINGQPFNIIKFRSMYTDAEKDGPQLSNEDDPRTTSWGKIMRKWRIDETPQFFNVLIGDMSLVGPRPERKYFIDKICEEAPYYRHLLKVRPGITSWGQVKYGYASNIQQMLARLKFDILYIENMSITLDIKILFYTIVVLLRGKGK